MKTIGQVIKDTRQMKRYSLVKLENITRIKKDFIEDLENENWSTLPPFPTVLGFVKKIASSLDLPQNNLVAILKRDYPPKKLLISPKPDISSKFYWSPKLTFLVGVIVFSSLVIGYLGFQYFRFISPPKLIIDSPNESQVVKGKSVKVSGLTDTDSKITVNNQPALIDEDGKFSIDIQVIKETKEIVVKSISRSGKETVIRRTISVE